MSLLPQRLLLATDLSPRCDRALDRAAQLCQQWQAELEVLSVLGTQRAPDQVLDWLHDTEDQGPQRWARRQLEQELARLGQTARLQLLADANPVDAILAHAAGSELVVTGVACDEPLGRFRLGSTVESLAHRLDCGLLVVRQRPHGGYRKVWAACDLGPHSPALLACAKNWFASAEHTLFHAQHLPAGLQALDGAPADAPTQAACQALAAAAGGGAGTGPKVLALQGRLVPTLTRQVRQHEVDLVVLGGPDGHFFFDALLGSSLGELLQWLPCDLLILPERGSTGG